MSYYKSKELREKRGEIAKQMNDMVIKAKQEERSLTPEEQQAFDRMDSEQTSLRDQAEGFERMEKWENSVLTERGKDTSSHPIKAGHNLETLTAKDRDLAFRAWLMYPHRHKSECRLDEKWIQLAERAGYSLADHSIELRTQSTTTGSEGGDLTQPEPLRALDKALAYYGGMRRASYVFQTSTGNDLPIPTTNDISNVGYIVGQNQADTTELPVTLGQKVMKAYIYSSGPVYVPYELLQDSKFPVDRMLEDLFTDRLGRITNTHYTTGTGVTQPYGVVTQATSSGVTGRDDNTVQFSELVDVYHSVDPAYRERPGCVWMGSDAMLGTIKKMTDSLGRPLWVPNLSANNIGDIVFGKPYIVNNAVAAPAANAKSLLFGDLGSYWIRDVQGIEFQRLVERRAEYRQVVFLAFLRTDGALVSAGAPIKYYQQGSTNFSG